MGLDLRVVAVAIVVLHFSVLSHAQSNAGAASRSAPLTILVERTGENATQAIDVFVYLAPAEERLMGGMFSAALPVAHRMLAPQLDAGGRDEVRFEGVPFGRLLVTTVRQDGATGVAVFEHGSQAAAHDAADAATDAARQATGARLVLHPGPMGALELHMPSTFTDQHRCFLSPGLSAQPIDELVCTPGTLSLPEVSRGLHELLIVDAENRVSRYPLQVEIKRTCRYELSNSGAARFQGCREPGLFEPDPIDDKLVEERLEQRDIGCDPIAGPEPSVLSALRIEAEMLLGAQWNEPAVDHAAIGAALSADLRLADALLLGLRAAWLTGGDAGRDDNGDGVDDEDTANPHLLLLSAGPTLRLGENGRRRGITALEFDARPGLGLALGGVSNSGLIVDSGARLTRGATHLGLRYLHGFVGLSDFRALVFAAGVGGGGQLEPDFVSNGCNRPPPETRGPTFAHGLRGELIVASVVLAEGGTLGPPGFALQFSVPVAPWLSPALRADVLYYPRADGDGVVQYGGSLGLRARILSPPTRRLFTSVYGGYAFSLGTKPSSFADGSFVDVGAAFELTEPDFEEGIYVGLRFRTGLSAENARLRALMLTLALDYDGDGKH